MFDYRNSIKKILNNVQADDRSLHNGLNAIKAIVKMADEELPEQPVKTKTQPYVQINQNNNLNNEIKLLLQAVTKLIELPGNPQAKSNAITAIHKLTFTAGVGKNFGHDLGKLDQAIQNSVESQASTDAKVFKKAMTATKPTKKEYRKGKRYLVIRLVSGADLVNDNGEIVYTVKESQIHSLNLKSGDIVEAIEDSKNPNYEAEILRVVGFQKLRKRDYDEIELFRYGVVQGKAGRLTISRDIHGNHLKIRGKEVTVSVDSSYYQGENIKIEDGAIVDLAWYSGDVRLKTDPSAAVQIRWIYQVDRPKTSNLKKKKTKIADTQVDTTQLALDLHYQRVGIAIGDNQNEAILEKIVEQYHGIPIPIDAFEGKKKVIENQIKGLSIVILVTAFAAHDSTWNIREYASKYHVKFAVSSSKGYKAFERALYRAENGLPAYEGNQTIDYEIKN